MQWVEVWVNPTLWRICHSGLSPTFQTVWIWHDVFAIFLLNHIPSGKATSSWQISHKSCFLYGRVGSYIAKVVYSTSLLLTRKDTRKCGIHFKVMISKFGISWRACKNWRMDPQEWCFGQGLSGFHHGNYITSCPAGMVFLDIFLTSWPNKKHIFQEDNINL